VRRGAPLAAFNQGAAVVLFETDQVLLHHLHLLGQLEERLEDLGLGRWCVQLRNQRVEPGHAIAQFIADAPHLTHRLGTIHDLN